MKEHIVNSWGFITGDRRINPDTWKRTHPQNLYGKVIWESRGFLTVRVYRKGGRVVGRKYFQEMPFSV